MTIKLKRLRATLIWAWAGEELVSGPGRSWWAADRTRYTEVFDTLRSGTAEPPWPVSMPWSGPRRQRFFAYTASEDGHEPRHQRELSGGAAFRQLVPLRAARLLAGLALGEGGGSDVVQLEGMLSPVGVALLLNIDLHGDWTPEAMADQWLRLLREPVFTTQDAASLRAGDLRDAARRALQQRCGMPAVAQPVGSDEPYAVLTALSAEGAEALPPAGPGPELHRALYGLASGLRDWRSLSLPAWMARVTAASTRHASGRACLTAPQRGLLVWHPDAIGADSTRAQTGALNCYHRNLCLALLQAQCALRYLRLCRTLRQGPGLSAQASDVLRRAVVMLSRLHGRSGYHTGAVPRWLSEDGDALDLLADERTRHGLPPLAG